MVPDHNKHPSPGWLEYKAIELIVEALLAEGYRPRIIYEGLSMEGLLTIPYKTFSIYLRRILRRNCHEEK